MNPLNNVLLIATGFILGNKSGREMANRGLEWLNEKSKEMVENAKKNEGKDDAGNPENSASNRDVAQ